MVVLIRLYRKCGDLNTKCIASDIKMCIDKYFITLK
jgi:hypothetical protein